jgi:hypothetical protein
MVEAPSNTLTFPVKDAVDVTVGIRRVREAGLLTGAAEVDQTLVATIISELASNIVKYAGRGTVRVNRVQATDGVDIEALADLRRHRQTPIKRGQRILKDELHAGADRAPGRRARRRQGGAVEPHDPTIGLFKAKRQPPGRGLAATGLAHNAQRLAARHMKAHIDNRIDGFWGGEKTALCEISSADASDLKQRRGR